VRSGVLNSVHSFATDPERGVYILAFLVVSIGGSLALYAWRAPLLKADGLFAPISREGGLVLNNLLLTVACFTVLTGTLYPLALDVVAGAKVSVGPPYFEMTFVPLMVPLFLALGIGPLMPWKRADIRGVLHRLRFVALITLAVWGLVWWRATDSSPLPAFGIAIAAWIALSVFLEFGVRIGLLRITLGESLRRALNLPRATYGMMGAHLGVAVLVAGVVASSSWRTEVIRAMEPGQSQEIVGYTVRFDGVAPAQGPNYSAERATFTVFRDGEQIAVMQPEKRFYPVSATQTTEAAIRTTLIADLYVVIGDQTAGQDVWAVRMYYNPLVPWIWFGSIMMFGSGLISLSDRRHRIGAPTRARAPSGVAPQAV